METVRREQASVSSRRAASQLLFLSFCLPKIVHNQSLGWTNRPSRTANDCMVLVSTVIADAIADSRAHTRGWSWYLPEEVLASSIAAL